MGTARTSRIGRLLRHLHVDRRHATRRFPAKLLESVEARIAQGERSHGGEMRVAIEASLAPTRVWRGLRPRDRALEVFGLLRVWDTAGNNGVLLYVLLADRAVEIVADRAAAAAIPEHEWRSVAGALSASFRERRYEAGLLAAVDRIGALLAVAFPPSGARANELPNRPELL